VITSLLLVAVFIVAGFLAPRMLGRSRWPYRAPRLGVAAWLIAAVTAALAALLICATVALPVWTAGHGLADLWHACLGGWRHYYGDTNPLAVGLAATATTAMVISLIRSVVSHVRAVGAVRRGQQTGLALLSVANGVGDRDLVVLPHPVPAAYCVPGRPGRVVMTDSAVRALESDQVQAVVAHERAHLAGHHARLVGLATVLRNGLGWTAPVFGRATQEVTALVEMIADDAAVQLCSAPRVAQALVTLAGGSAPRSALAASGAHLVRRVRRLTTPPRPLGIVPRWITRIGLIAALAIPVATVAGPLVAVVVAASCADAGHG
jgi:Zn-dependent protease with chaperone function